MKVYGLEIQQAKTAGDILIEGMLFNIGGIKMLRKAAERGAIIRLSLNNDYSIICEEIKPED